MREKRDGRFAPIGVLPHVTLPRIELLYATIHLPMTGDT